jgi:hypothetical protein
MASHSKNAFIPPTELNQPLACAQRQTACRPQEIFLKRKLNSFKRMHKPEELLSVALLHVKGTYNLPDEYAHAPKSPPPDNIP